MQTWKSYRVYYQFQPGYDGLILLLAEQLERLAARGRISKWFFLRYWEDGPHIRVRYLMDGELGEEELFDKVRAYIQRYPSIRKLSKEEYFQGHKFDGEPLELQNLDWYEEGEIISKRYEPEVERYGGASLMPLTESLFMESSRLAGGILELTAGSTFTRRLLTGMRVLEELAESIFTRIPRLGRSIPSTARVRRAGSGCISSATWSLHPSLPAGVRRTPTGGIQWIVCYGARGITVACGMLCWTAMLPLPQRSRMNSG